MHGRYKRNFIAHNLLEGKIVPGNHEKLVSQEMTLKVNGLLSINAQSYKINEENEAIPLNQSLRCDRYGEPM